VEKHPSERELLDRLANALGRKELAEKNALSAWLEDIHAKLSSISTVATTSAVSACTELEMTIRYPLSPLRLLLPVASKVYGQLAKLGGHSALFLGYDILPAQVQLEIPSDAEIFRGI